MFRCIVCNKKLPVTRPSLTHCECTDGVYGWNCDCSIKYIMRRRYKIPGRIFEIWESQGCQIDGLGVEIYFCAEWCHAKLCWTGMINRQDDYGIPWEQIRNDIVNTYDIGDIIDGYLLICSKSSRPQLDSAAKDKITNC